MKRRTMVLAALLAWSAGALPCVGAEAKLNCCDYVGVIGDSITEQQLYSLFMEEYLLMCRPAAKLRVTQFGWAGETAPGFASRMENDVLRFRPTVVTICYGMNDGGYSAMDAAKGQRYRDGQKSILAQLKKASVRLIVLGSPGCVDFDTYSRNPETTATYNKTLAALRDLAQQAAKEEGVVFANVYDPMMAVMIKAKAKYGKDYHVCGADGYHPDRNGHLVMAYVFLKALGCDGDLGTIRVDLAADQAEASEGHKVLSCRKGVVEIESSRYPFCFFGDPAQPTATRGIIEFLPFNEDLNRLTLVVRGASGSTVKVSWGAAAKPFSAAELAKGINLAAEFVDNPFSEPFRKVEAVIVQKQAMEVGLVQDLIHNLPGFRRLLSEEAPALDRIGQALVKHDQQARDTAAAAVKPVEHVLRIEAVK